MKAPAAGMHFWQPKTMRTPLFDETKFSIFSRSSTWPALTERLDSVALEPREAIQVCVVASRRALPDILRQRQDANSERFQIRELDRRPNDDIPAFSLARRFGGADDRLAKGEFLLVPTRWANITLLLFIETVTFWHNGLSWFLDSIYPRVVRPFLSQSEMSGFLRNVQNAIPSHRVRILRTSARERLRSGEARKRYASSLKWTDSDADTIFREARAANVWFRNVYFELASVVNDRFVSEETFATVSKYGYFACTARFSLFFRTVIEPMIQAGAERLKFLGDRGRQASSHYSPKPLKIEYDNEVFSSPAQIGKLLEALKKFRHGSCSVLHANPYLHVTMIDNFDFSSAEVWVLNKNEVLIMPQVRTSDAALKRIINHIYEHFREGKLVEASFERSL